MKRFLQSPGSLMPFAAMMVSAAGIFLSATAKPDDSAPAGQAPQLVVQVLDESGKPLPDATVKARNERRSKTLQTDEHGEVSFPQDLVKARTIFQMAVEAPNDVTLSRSWRPDLGQKVPDRITVHMQPGTKIGGIVQNDQGEPIKNAKVLLLIPNQNNETEFQASLWDSAVTTDSTGHWQFDLFPPKANDVWIRLEHPDYISNHGYNEAGRLSIEQLRAGTGTLIMRKGIKVEGTVTDDQGTPIVGARVLEGGTRLGSNYPEITTDDSGKFLFANTPPGPLVLTVVADNWMPELRRLTVAPDMGPVDFKLSHGKTMRVKVVDADGHPLEKAWVVPDTWRECRTLHNVGLPRETDANGIWQWTYAPADAVMCDVSKQGFMSARLQSMVARDEPYTVTLQKMLQISGKVLDAETKAPIPEFHVIQGIAFNDSDNRVTWERRQIGQGGDGRFNTKFTYPYNAVLVRIEADGYLPADSRRVKQGEGSVTCDFLLHKGESVTGVVRLPNGKPAAGAEVGLATVNSGLYVQGGNNRHTDSAPWTTTDVNGKFTLPPQTERFDLLVLHDQGARRVTGVKPANWKQIDLQPWAKVEGTLRVGKNPGVGEPVILGHAGLFNAEEPRIYFDDQTTTDKDGRFQFDRVFPGTGSIGRQIKFGVREGGSMTSNANSQNADFVAGQTQHITLGGTGQAVIGKLTAPQGEQIDWNFAIVRLGPQRTMPSRQNLAAQLALTILRSWLSIGQERSSANTPGMMSDESKNFAAAVQPDGTFRIDDVGPGKYTLSVQVSERPPVNQCGMGEEVATLSRDLEIAAGSAADEQAMDLGTLALSMVRRIKVGDLAPNFEVTTLEGNSFKLADQRGKYVLVDFWATWCGPCVGEVPFLLAAHEHFGDRKNFAMVGLSADMDKDTLASFVSNRKIAWPQSFLGPGSAVANDYGVKGIPSIFLIGPDGKVVAKELRGEAIEKTLADQLK